MLRIIESIFLQLLKLVKLGIRITFIVWIAYVFIGWNINRYSLYYAQYTPHSKDSDPVLMTVVDKLRWIDRPTLDDIIYDFDGRPAIIGQLYEIGESEPFFERSSDGYSYFDLNDTYYSFNKKFKLTYSSDSQYKKR